MSSSEEVQSIILEPMRALYRVPFGIEDPERALVEYARVLRNHSTANLQAGWNAIVLSHKRRDWPSIYEFIELFDKMAAEARRQRAIIDAANSIPDPWSAFCVKVLAFVKRDRKTFEDFRNAGVRAIQGEQVLAFDTTDLAGEIAKLYGDELDAMMGFHVGIEGPANGRWNQARWKDAKAFSP
jgi:hypothetical protein